jgi:hypothetical protein
MWIERCYLCPIFFNYANNIINQIRFFKSTFVKGPFGRREEKGVDGKLRKKWRRLKFSTVWYKRNVEGQKEGRGGDVFHTCPHFPIDPYMRGNIDENRFVR